MKAINQCLSVFSLNICFKYPSFGRKNETYNDNWYSKSYESYVMYVAVMSYGYNNLLRVIIIPYTILLQHVHIKDRKTVKVIT